MTPIVEASGALLGHAQLLGDWAVVCAVVATAVAGAYSASCAAQRLRPRRATVKGLGGAGELGGEWQAAAEFVVGWEYPDTFAYFAVSQSKELWCAIKAPQGQWLRFERAQDRDRHSHPIYVYGKPAVQFTSNQLKDLHPHNTMGWCRFVFLWQLHTASWSIHDGAFSEWDYWYSVGADFHVYRLGNNTPYSMAFLIWYDDSREEVLARDNDYYFRWFKQRLLFEHYPGPDKWSTDWFGGSMEGGPNGTIH